MQVLKAREAIRKTSLVVALFIFLVGSLLGRITINSIVSRNKILAEDKQLTDRIAALEKQTVGLKRERTSYLDVRNRLLKQATFVRRLNRVSSSEIFGHIVSALPEDISLLSFELAESGKVGLKGSTLKIDTLAEFIRKINAIAYFEDVKFDFLREKEIKGRRIVEFDIYTKLRADVE